ncbi:MAG: hypothetical protein LLG45_06755 [Actinomycetia bacterium]|nr:hypothetical protein [Actinomycetes bacterium]
MTSYSATTLVDREALVVTFAVPASEIYTKNRAAAAPGSQAEYWVHKQGVRFGTGARSALVYNEAAVSSFQVDSEKARLFVNLDWSSDHPHVNIPYQEDRGGRWVDQSMALYPPGSERQNSFSLHIGPMPKIVPRIMAVPYGYLAGYVFTEHADGGNIDTHRAVYFGASSVKDIGRATAGFVGNNIPVTKSVFYANPEALTYSSIVDDPQGEVFLDFLDQLAGTGRYDLCLHTPEGNNSTRGLLEEAIRFMSSRYGTVTWIDHGMLDGSNNRESFVADGLNPDSSLYAADLWERFGTRYFWNTAVEILRSASRLSFREKLARFRLYGASVALWRRSFLPLELQSIHFVPAVGRLLQALRSRREQERNSLRPLEGEAYPTPLYWQHPTRTGAFFSWGTDYAYDFSGFWSEDAERQLAEELREIDALVANRGVFINHGYYIRKIPNIDVTYEEQGIVLLNGYFERMLEYMAQLRDQGDLYIGTIRDLMQYWTVTEKIEFEYMPDGTIHVLNPTDKPIYGLTLAARLADVQVDGARPHSRTAGDDTLFWFDIAANGSAVLKVEPRMERMSQDCPAACKPQDGSKGSRT